MLVFFDERLVYFAVPKTGSVAIETTLAARANIAFRKAQRHIPVRRYRKAVAPLLKSGFRVKCETFAVIREPMQHMESWYRFRNRGQIQGAPASAQGRSYDEFIEAFLGDTPPEWAQVGTQHRFLAGPRGNIPVNHLFAHDAQDQLLSFLNQRFADPVELPRLNVSPVLPTPLSDGNRTRLQQHLAPDIALYQKVTAAGGYLHNPAPRAKAQKRQK